MFSCLDEVAAGALSTVSDLFARADFDRVAVVELLVAVVVGVVPTAPSGSANAFVVLIVDCSPVVLHIIEMKNKLCNFKERSLQKKIHRHRALVDSLLALSFSQGHRVRSRLVDRCRID